MNDTGTIGTRIARDLALISVDLPTLDEYFRRAANTCAQALQAHGALVALVVPQGLHVEFTSLPNESTDEVLSDASVGEALRTGAIRHDPLGAGVLAIPFATPQGESAGVLCVAAPEIPIGPADLTSLEIAAIHISGYVMRARTEAELVSMRDQALRDGLTQIPNRRAFDERLRNEWERARRGKYPLSLIFIDVDHFGAYNTRYGHPAGDETLVSVANALRDGLQRDSDFVARYGGEEFVVILPATPADGAIVVAERLRKAVAQFERKHESTALGRLTISLGAACVIPLDSNAEHALIAAADECLLTAKARGRNRLVCEGYESNTPANERRYEHRHNLPNHITRFIGRSRERDELYALVISRRLTSLVGPGGVGKTRLACEVAARCSERYADGARFIDLSTVTNADALLPAIAHALGIRGEAAASLQETIVDSMVDSEALLVLDNCEQIIDALSPFIEALLHACARVRLLCTTRHRFDLAGETAYTLEPLTAEDARELFLDRIQSATAATNTVLGDARLMHSVCDRLDRLPLALELVAPRVPSLGLERMLSVLDDRAFVLSTSQRRTRKRQQTVANLLDWSYRLLSENERSIFNRLSVLVGSWDADAAIAICSDEHLKPGEVRAALAELVGKSLLSYDTILNQYHMLELTAQFAREKLEESGQYTVFRGRHCVEFARRSARINDDSHQGRLT